ncbi:MAG: glycosyltransferase [Microcoleaceae cyanobacterium]
MTSMTGCPCVSVIIPAYNGDHFVAQAITSVLQQDYCDYEIIVVDDGSTDETARIVQSFGSKVRYIQQENQGVAVARNRGIEAAKGQLIALLDQDDIFLPSKLTEQVRCFTNNPEVGLVNSGWRLINLQGEKISEIEPWHHLPELNLATWVIHTPILPGAMMFHKDWWEKVGGFDPQFHGVDDVDFVWRLVLAGCQSKWLPQATVGYRQHEQAVSSYSAVSRARMFITAQDHLFNQPNLPESVRQLETSARYEGLTWMAWHLYHTDHFVEMAVYLEQSLSFTSKSKPLTITDWVKRFMGYCQSYGYSLNTRRLRNSSEWQDLITRILPKQKPRVSVIIPAYNSDRFIEKAVYSVLEQNYEKYEVIVIDDGSTDNIDAVLQPYLDVIQSVYQHNQGAAIARNQGCQLAQGEFLAFLDSDDFFLPDKLTEQVAIFDSNPDIDLVQTGWFIVDSSEQPLAMLTPWETIPELNLAAWVLHKCVRPSAMMIRRDWWEKVGGFDHRYPPTEDLDFVLRLGLMGCRAVWLEKVYACYRQHDSNLMSGGERVIKNTEKIMNEFFDRPDLPAEIQKLQPKERYQRWVWLAWRMYRDRYPKLMLDCLEKSLVCSPYTRTETLSHWIEAFGRISAEYGELFQIQELIKTPEWQQVLDLLWRQPAAVASPSDSTTKQSISSQKSLRIALMNTDDPGIGGLAQYDHLILCELAKKGHQVTAIRPRHSSPLVEQEKALGIQQFWLDYSTSQDLSRILRNTKDAEALYAEIQPDFLIFSDGWPFSHFAAKQVAIQQQIPYMIALGLATPDHVNFSMGDGISYTEGVLYQYGLARAVNVAAKEHLEILHRQFKLPETQGNVIYYGRSERYFAPPNLETRQRLRQEFNIPEEGILCFTSARLAPIKGHHYQLDAIAQLQTTSARSKLYFVWAGTGQGSDLNLEPELKEKAQKLGLSDRLIFLGQRWDIPDWLDASDIFILTSLAEAAPSFAVMEAMAKGLPVVASAAGGIPEGLGETGKLLPDPNVDPAGTVRELVATLQVWAEDSNLRQKIGQACQQRAEQLFKEDRMLRETLAVIQQAIDLETHSEFSQLSLVQTKINHLNQRLNYSSLVWNGWSAYRRGNHPEMVQFLQDALQSSPFEFASEIVVDWINDFVRLSLEKGNTFEGGELSQLPEWKQLIESTLSVF